MGTGPVAGQQSDAMLQDEKKHLQHGKVLALPTEASETHNLCGQQSLIVAGAESTQQSLIVAGAESTQQQSQPRAGCPADARGWGRSCNNAAATTLGLIALRQRLLDSAEGASM